MKTASSLSVALLCSIGWLAPPAQAEPPSAKKSAKKAPKKAPGKATAEQFVLIQENSWLYSAPRKKSDRIKLTAKTPFRWIRDRGSWMEVETLMKEEWSGHCYPGPEALAATRLRLYVAKNRALQVTTAAVTVEHRNVFSTYAVGQAVADLPGPVGVSATGIRYRATHTCNAGRVGDPVPEVKLAARPDQLYWPNGRKAGWTYGSEPVGIELPRRKKKRFCYERGFTYNRHSHRDEELRVCLPWKKGAEMVRRRREQLEEEVSRMTSGLEPSGVTGIGHDGATLEEVRPEERPDAVVTIGHRRGNDIGIGSGIGYNGDTTTRELGKIEVKLIVLSADDDTSLTPEVVGRRVIKTYLSGVKTCYRRHLRRNASVSGQLKIRFGVGESGRVTRVLARGVHKDVASCAQQGAKAWRFDKPKDKDGEPSTADFRMALSLQESK